MIRHLSFTCALLFSLLLHAKGRHEIGLLAGPLLIADAVEVMPAYGGRATIALNSSHIKHIEIQGLKASTESGINYALGELTFRNEFEVEKISALWLLGFNWHHYQPRLNGEYTDKRGWHVGTGINLEVNKNTMFRNDYILHFAGGMSLVVTLGFSWAFGAPDEKKN